MQIGFGHILLTWLFFTYQDSSAFYNQFVPNFVYNENDLFLNLFQTCAKETVTQCIVMKQNGRTMLSVKMSCLPTSPRNCVAVQRRGKPGTLPAKFARLETQVRIRTVNIFKIQTFK